MKHSLHPEGHWGRWGRGKGRCDGGILGYSSVNAVMEISEGGEEGQVILPGGMERTSS